VKHGDTYVFVVDADTHRILFHGHDPSRVGATSPHPRRRGRAFGHWGVQALAGKRTGVDFYNASVRARRTDLEGDVPAPRAGPGGERYVVGSGVYDLVPDRRFVVELVDMRPSASSVTGGPRWRSSAIEGPSSIATRSVRDRYQGNVLADPSTELERRTRST